MTWIFPKCGSTWNITIFKNSKDWYITTAPELLLSFQELQGIFKFFFFYFSEIKAE